MTRDAERRESFELGGPDPDDPDPDDPHPGDDDDLDPSDAAPGPNERSRQEPSSHGVERESGPGGLLVFLDDPDAADLPVGRAVLAGHALVSGGVVAIVAATMILGSLYTSLSLLSLALLGTLAAWPWWSVTVPRWWRWALARGADPYELQRVAEATQLVWPRDSWLERTELGDRWEGIDTPVLRAPGTLRDRLLSETTSSGEGEREGPLWAVIAEYGLSGGTWSLIVFDDGACALETSAGATVSIEAGERASVERAARVLLAAARDVAERLAPTTDVSRPRSGEVAFFLLFAEGVVGLREARAGRVERGRAARVLQEAARRVIEAVREGE